VDETDRVFRALADETRRLIVDELRERNGQTLFGLCVALIERHGVAISRQAISKHLAMLEEAGIVRTEWAGRTKMHHLDLGPIRRVRAGWLGGVTKRGERT
jgi:DNA-binding transcriptional ArsR family regulator